MTDKLNVYDNGSAWKSIPPENLSERHILIQILIDTSGSMFTKQAALNKAVRELLDGLQNDPTTRGAAEVCIIGFGGSEPKVLLHFSPLRLAQAPVITCSGGTPMYAAVEMGLDLLEKRRAELKQRNPPVPMYKPFIFILTDGAANDRVTDSFKRLRELQKPSRPGAKYGKIFVYPIGLGDEFKKKENQLTVASLSHNREFYTGDYSSLSNFFCFVSTTTTSALRTVEGTAVELPDPEEFGFKRQQISFNELIDD